MKILSDNNDYIISLSIALGKLGHKITTVDTNNVYNLVRSDRPDLVFAGNIDSTILQCCIRENLPTLLYGDGPHGDMENCIGVCSNRHVNDKSIIIDNFGDRNLYGGFPQHKLECDVLFSTNYNLSFLPRLQFLQNYDIKIKIAGRNHIKSPYFVGFTDNDSFGSLAKSAKIVITSNYFEYISLIHQDVFSLNTSNNGDMIDLIRDEKYRRHLMKENKEKFKDNTSDKQALKINDRIMAWKS